MDLLELLKAAIYGVVEGITEWLPISSTGHMLLLEQFMPLSVSKDFWDMFLVVIQLGAIIAVLVAFFHELNPFSRSKSADERRSTWTLWGKTIVACIPAAVVGLPLDNWIEDHLGTPFVIAAALIVYGIVFIVIETVRERRAQRLMAAPAPTAAQASGPYRPRHLAAATPQPQQELTISQVADADARIQDIDDLDWKTALGIGLFQVLSIVPGTSRSGSTIIGGLILGCSRTVVAQFTFYLAIPVMVGASGLRLVKYFLKGNTFSGTEAAILLTGCAVAFLVSLAAIRFLMGFVKKHDFKPFGWYRIVLGVAVIAYFALVAA
ncbi:UDP pyrophosphate phosphatase [Tractidigestivibacter scatoligenes]|uniref:Undecaprenyl-diphosphatase n=1 Tax=Tractidigestivibacter scatoligenes TaxID=1299998 RepID=A0A100YVH3_TRASO|nr:undecaprenyl-diphosphate phosphatase [Tractidigestivibacter scatoligenes]KUH58172.1 UDP pyrophosphate phosphatase [Tractidigestivibacter scatoligenes]